MNSSEICWYLTWKVIGILCPQHRISRQNHGICKTVYVQRNIHKCIAAPYSCYNLYHEQNVSSFSLSVTLCSLLFAFCLANLWLDFSIRWLRQLLHPMPTIYKQAAVFSLFSFPSLSLPLSNQSTKLVERIVRIIFFHKLLLLLLYA